MYYAEHNMQLKAQKQMVASPRKNYRIWKHVGTVSTAAAATMMMTPAAGSTGLHRYAFFVARGTAFKTRVPPSEIVAFALSFKTKLFEITTFFKFKKKKQANFLLTVAHSQSVLTVWCLG
jgi:hypothetical protein